MSEDIELLNEAYEHDPNMCIHLITKRTCDSTIKPKTCIKLWVMRVYL